MYSGRSLRFSISIAQYGRDALGHARASTYRCSHIIDYLTAYDDYEVNELDDNCSDDERHDRNRIFEIRNDGDDGDDDE